MCSAHPDKLKSPATCMQILCLYLLQEVCVTTSRRRRPKPSLKLREGQLVASTQAANKEQLAAKRQAAKTGRHAKKAKEAAKAVRAYEVRSNAVLICKHQRNALQTTMEWMAALQVLQTVRGHTGVPEQLPPK